jgi:hypothetical protein
MRQRFTWIDIDQELATTLSPLPSDFDGIPSSTINPPGFLPTRKMGESRQIFLTFGIFSGWHYKRTP